ncbi:hypothetical protein SO802_006329 [Lithocarpus litseifolius]|uniref:Reverse transcriptase n=1 Tax=Lithocarpus litseifolius TaxID=425828 RepID=A0AAW2DQC4_9ROSI
MQRFMDTLNWCDLRDLGFIGPKFTWLYNMFDGTQIQERLDRALATVDWLIKFPSAKLFHKSSSVSDHCPHVLQLIIWIWDDKWLPNSSSYKVNSPKSSNPSVSLVSDLIDVDNKRQNTNLLQQLFLPFEADYIGGIPLSMRLPKDKLIWIETTIRLFTVTSAYKIALDLSTVKEAVSLSNGDSLWLF